MLRACGGRCQCCKIPFSEILNEQPRIDHAHSSGRIRGLLFHQCNVILGFANDNPKVLRACACYLELERSASVEGEALDQSITGIRASAKLDQ